MSFKKVVFLRYLPLTQKISKDFYFEEISESGIKVEYWDVSFILEGVSQIGEFKSEVTRHFSCYKDVKNAIKSENRDSTLFVLIMTYNGDVLRLYSLLSRYKCILSAFGRNTFPTPAFSRNAILSSFVISRRFVKKLILNKLSVLAKRLRFVKGYDIMFLAGEKGVEGIGRVTPEEVEKAEVVKINSDDYDRSLTLKEQGNVINFKYAVFLDEYLPLHQDLEIVGMKSISADFYYRDLNKTFDKIEKKYGIRVIIAAHPKAVRYKSEDFFYGRKVVWGKTSELCKNCEFVLAHDSTSVNYAVIYNKAIVSLISNDIESVSPVIANSIKAFSSYLNTSIVYIDNPVLDNLKLSIDSVSYNHYKYDFLTSAETESNLTSSILVKYLQN